MEHSGNYGFIVDAVMAGWYPLCFLLFMLLPPARAVAVGLVTGFLLLPNVIYDLPGIPNYDKGLAIVLGVCVAAVICDPARFLGFRPRWVDLPVLMLCLAPFLSAVMNGDGAYRGLSNAFDFLVRWALPWFLGRLYFAEFEAQKYLALAVIVGALIYVPFALWEVKMSPQLHREFYNVMLRSFKHARRSFGLWRPNVFVSHGLAYALFNSLAALCAFWLWHTKAVLRVWGFPMGFVVGTLVFMTFAAQSSNAILLLGLGISILLLGTRHRLAFPVLVLVLVPPTYVSLRQGLRWDAEELVELAENVFGKSRAISLNVRIESEKELRDKILERPWFGYDDFKEFTGNKGRELENETGGSPVLVDSRWLLYLGLYGVFALAGLWLMQLLPPFLLWRRLPSQYWSHPALAAMAVLAVASLLVTLDGLLNAFEIQAFTAGAGGVAHLLGTKEGRRLWQP
ncbi:MAG: hypothetical protein EXS08_06345 [Planctomycetes bacterium]|nr:hypothetical protein [Planctomycetota bacterium]